MARAQANLASKLDKVLVLREVEGGREGRGLIVSDLSSEVMRKS